MKADWLMRRRKFLGMLGGSAVLMAGGAMPRSAGGEPAPLAPAERHVS